MLSPLMFLSRRDGSRVLEKTFLGNRADKRNVKSSDGFINASPRGEKFMIIKFSFFKFFLFEKEREGT